LAFVPHVDDPLAEWLDGLGLKIIFLEDAELPADAGVPFDFSGDSLRQLESFVLDRFGVPDDVLDFDEREFTEGVTAYLGETLMRVGGGSWEWATGIEPEAFPDGLPRVRSDGALGLEPFVPLLVLQEAVEQGDGERFSRLYREWESAVEHKRAEQPSWQPVKERTIADSPDPSSEDLAAWLERRSQGFAGWARTYGGEWNFSADSLPALEELVRRITPTAAELNDPAHRDFRDGAAWYLGEVMRRGMGGRWNYDTRISDDRNFPFLEGLGPWGSVSTPVISLENALAQPGYLLSHYEDFAA
jgi:hypothetical protein